MTQIKPEDLIITVYPTRQQGRGGMSFGSHESGIQVYHKPSGITVKFDEHRSQHRNKACCIKILEDLLTEFKEGDIVVDPDTWVEVSQRLASRLVELSKLKPK